MSNREELNTIELPGSVSIFPTRDGVVLLKNDDTELWTFDMSTSLRSLSEVTPSDSRNVWVEVYRPNATPLFKVLSSTLPSRSMILELDKMIVVIVFNLFYYAILRKRKTSLVYLPSQ